MDLAFSQTEVGNLIREKSSELGGVGAALAYVHNHLRDVMLGTVPAVPLHDVFPLSPLRRLPGKLCRCRGMIQEVEPNITLYRASCADFFGTVSGDDAAMLEATLFYVIPVPGNAHFYDAQHEGAADDERTAFSEQMALRHASMGRKRRYRPDDDQQQQQQQSQHDENEGGVTERGTRQRREDAVVPQSRDDPQPVLGVPLHQQLNLPHPPVSAALHTACIVTVIQHSNADKERLQLNDVVDFFGFLDDPPASLSTHDTGEFDELEGFGAWHAEELPSGLLSRMTCMSWRHVYSAPERPLLPVFFESRRPLVVQYMTHTICEGDALLAEYILLHLCSRVVTHESATPIGDVPLRVEGQDLNPGAWSAYLRDVVPVGEVLLDGTQLLDTTRRITPQQDQVTNVLRTGMLQLANGTHVTLDCSAVAKSTSTLQDALFVVIHKEMLPLEYPYQMYEVPIDLSFLALSSATMEEEVELLRFAVSLRWTPELPVDAAPSNGLTTDDVRDYLAQVRCVRRRFEKDNPSRALGLADRLVSFGRSEPRWNNHDPFLHNNSFSMTAALIRACAASFGREVISDDDVEHVLSLERRRMARQC
ncbi:E2F target protein 1 [Trypanosoma grayi]|uniref:E2F target protein 1 n=1 Tax=Trypanosoma grayi TaxID=71804 RepID=UPI0004F492A7|nr:E2F target protein 1 [Trypanosoma grayi]KEG12228.1 E2F target protein 1 [Trypanosoma grayi]